MTVYPPPPIPEGCSPEPPTSTLDGRFLRVEHGCAAYVVVDLADIDGDIPQPVSVPTEWNMGYAAMKLEKAVKPIIQRAIACGATWEISPRRGIATAIVYIQLADLPIATPSDLSKALANIESRIEATHA